MEMKFYKCELCGQMVAIVKETGAELICCDKPMTLIEPKSKDVTLIKDKHIPVYRLKGSKLLVYVGVVPHPTTSDHYIEWIAIRTNKGNQRKELKPGDAPKATFVLDEDEYVEEIYAYCNIHSLWVYKEKDRRNSGCKACEIHM